MSQNGQKSTNPADYQHVLRAVAAMPKDFPQDFVIEPHSHERAQLIYAPTGTMRVITSQAMWVVPPQRALWMPAGTVHGIEMLDQVTMRTLYLRDDAAAAMPLACRVLQVSQLLRELIVRATELPLQYDEDGPAGHVVALLLDELHGSQALKLHLPMPRSKRLAMLCRALLDEPGDRRTLGEWAHTTLDGSLAQTIAKMTCQRDDFTPAYDCPQAARTTNAVDRLHNHLDRVLYAMSYCHGRQASARLAVRAWALQWNFHPYGPRLRHDEPHRASPFADLNGFFYHPNWLHNFLIAASMGGLRL